jgi:hypothetical protein
MYTEEEVEKVINLALNIVQLDEKDYYSFMNGTSSINEVPRKLNRKELINIIRQFQGRTLEYIK